MIPTLKLLHLLALVLFLGSIPGHVLLGRLATGATAPGEAALLLGAKHLSALALTLPGLALTVASGALLLAIRRELLGRAWMRMKLGLVALVAANGVLLLTPTGESLARLAEAAAGGALPAEAGALAAREGMLGAANLAMVLAILALAVARPGAGRRAARIGGAAP
jgi:hypothetical protein